MKIRDLFQGCNQAFRNSEPTFQTRLLYAELSSPYDVYAESKFGYLAAAKELLESYKPIDELEAYIDKYEATDGNNTIYDKGYLQAYRDFVKQEKNKECETNE